MGLVGELERRKVIIVPHGSFVAYLSLEEHKKMTIPYFGNKAVLDWEASRELQREWLSRAGITMPRQFKSGAEIDRPVIVKLYGAGGGKGYMFIRDAHDFEKRVEGAEEGLHDPGIHHRRSALHPLFLFAAAKTGSRSCRWIAATRPTSIRSAAFRPRRRKAWT